MFGKKETVNLEKIESLIGKNMIIEGKIITESSMRIEGTVKGEIEAQGDVFIGEKGKVQGNILARNILIAGEVVGETKANGRLEITQTGSLEGDMDTQILVVNEGAKYQGHCSMRSQTPEVKQASVKEFI